MKKTVILLAVAFAAAAGAYTGEVPTSFENGICSFKLGTVYPSIYYLLSI